MKKIFFLTITFLTFLSCSNKGKENITPNPPLPEVPSEDTDMDKVRVLTYNVHYCTPVEVAGNTIPDVRATANAILAANPDVVLLQELDIKTTRSGNVDQLELLSKYTKMPYYYFTKGIDFQGGEFGVGYLSKYPIDKQQSYLLPKLLIPGKYVEQRALSVVNVSFPNGKKITFGNTHLDLTPENRLLQVPEILKVLKEAEFPVVFGGDLNDVSGSETLNMFDNDDFNRTCSQNCNSIPSRSPNKEIDFIMFKPSEKLKLVEQKVYQNILASDHLPVLAVFEFK